MVLKLLKTLRNNWKKSIFFTGVAVYGVHYAKGKYHDSVIRRVYCEEARKYGEKPIRTGERSRRITVFLNPAAHKGKGRAIFEKNVAPILHVAGIEVTIVKTEYEGQAQKYMEVLDDTDAVIVAGGDGTLLEVVTGLLRREDQEKASKIPVGVLPIGLTNTLAQGLFHRGESDVRWQAEAGLSIVKNQTKPLDVMHIKGGENKSVYAVTGLEWGAFRDAEERKQKYWITGPLKHRLTYIISALKNWPPLIRAELSYSHPCEGCSNCYTPPVIPQWRWWHIFLPPRIEVPKKDYSLITNEDCGKEYRKEVTALEFASRLSQHQNEKEEEKAINLIMGPEVSRTEYIKEGWRRVSKKDIDGSFPSECVKVGKFTLSPQLEEGEESWFTIDNENYEAMPVQVELLKDKIHVFYNNVPLEMPT